MWIQEIRRLLRKQRAGNRVGNGVENRAGSSAASRAGNRDASRAGSSDESRAGRNAGKCGGGKNRRRLAAVVLLILAVFVAGDLLLSRYGLTCTCYEISAEGISSAVRIVQLTDLHNSVFGAGNERLVEMVRRQEPDLILITGDLLNSDVESTEVAVSLIADLTEIAPVYFSYGNHEKEYEENYGVDIAELFSQASAHVLEYSYEDIEVNGQLLRIGGLYGYCIPDKFLKTGEANEAECSFLWEFQETERYTILLCHMPYCWIVNDGISEWDIDCVFAGHVHGGQIRIPLIGGLWAPDQGWFPGEECGLYYSDDREKVMVLSRGLGSTEIVPRFNNIPEVVVVDLVPQG